MTMIAKQFEHCVVLMVPVIERFQAQDKADDGSLSVRDASSLTTALILAIRDEGCLAGEHDASAYPRALRAAWGKQKTAIDPQHMAETILTAWDWPEKGPVL